MAESFGHDFERDPLLEEQGGMGVSELVERDGLDIGAGS
jgi:hypothetical protein